MNYTEGRTPPAGPLLPWDLSVVRSYVVDKRPYNPSCRTTSVIITPSEEIRARYWCGGRAEATMVAAKTKEKIRKLYIHSYPLYMVFWANGSGGGGRLTGVFGRSTRRRRIDETREGRKRTWRLGIYSAGRWSASTPWWSYVESFGDDRDVCVSIRNKRHRIYDENEKRLQTIPFSGIFTSIEILFSKKKKHKSFARLVTTKMSFR